MVDAGRRRPGGSQPESLAQPFAAAWPEQADDEGQRQSQNDEASDEKQGAGGMFHVEKESSGKWGQEVSGGPVEELSSSGADCTRPPLTLH
jgi:hypothetical protein